MFVFGRERDYVVHDSESIKGFFGEYRWMSNFHECEVLYEGLVYPSAENAYQAAKSLDTTIRSEFLCIKPNKSKQLGRKIECRPDWEEVKYGIMYNICLDKFIRNPELGDMLVETGDRYIEESNHWGDKIWGVCDGEGSNWLGKILMDIRESLR